MPEKKRDATGAGLEDPPQGGKKARYRNRSELKKLVFDKKVEQLIVCLLDKEKGPLLLNEARKTGWLVFPGLRKVKFIESPSPAWSPNLFAIEDDVVFLAQSSTSASTGKTWEEEQKKMWERVSRNTPSAAIGQDVRRLEFEKKTKDERASAWAVGDLGYFYVKVPVVQDEVGMREAQSSVAKSRSSVYFDWTLADGKALQVLDLVRNHGNLSHAAIEAILPETMTDLEVRSSSDFMEYACRVSMSNVLFVVFKGLDDPVLAHEIDTWFESGGITSQANKDLPTRRFQQKRPASGVLKCEVRAYGSDDLGVCVYFKQEQMAETSASNPPDNKNNLRGVVRTEETGDSPSSVSTTSLTEAKSDSDLDDDVLDFLDEIKDNPSEFVDFLEFVE